VVTSDERPDSLAEQAAAWVPPWERAPRPAGRPEPAAGEADLRTDDHEPVADDLEEFPSVVAVESAPVVAGSPADTGSAHVDRPALVTARRASGEDRATALALIDDAELRGALEAILLVVDEPVSEVVLGQVLEQPAERIATILARIATGYTTGGHGFELRRAAGGWRLYTRAEFAPYVERFVLDGQSVRLTQAALETLAVVAYKQPVTRSRISAIRGVNCDGVIRTLVSRGLVEECGTEPDSGAYLYRTTILFLEKLGLDSVDELPSLAPFLPDDVEEMADAQR